MRRNTVHSLTEVKLINVRIMKLDFDWWRWLVITAFACLVMSFFCRCKSKQSVVTQQTYITDKENEKKWDSLFNLRLIKELERFQSYHSEKSEKTLKDVTHIKDSTSARYDANGNKIGEDKYHYELRSITEKDVQKLKDSIGYYKGYVDSVIYYRLKSDSLNKKIESISKEKIYVEKNLTKMQKMYIALGKMFLWLAIAAILAWFIRRKK